MHLDPLTLMIPDALATTCAGVMLLAACWHFKDVLALRWWTAALLISSVGLTLVTIGLVTKSPPVVLCGVAATTLVSPLILAGAESFSQHRIRLAVLLAGPVAWLVVGVAPFDFAQEWWTTLLSFVFTWVYLLAAAWFLWREADDAYSAKYPLIAFLGLHAVVFMGASYDLMTGVLILEEPPPVDSWFGTVLFESILFAIGAPVFMLLLCKQRVDKTLIQAATLDSLTGTANRGALLKGAMKLVERSRIDGTPCAVIVFDLDHFKLINDNHGHQGGDRVLRGFAETARTVLRANDLFGRYGGEEFVAVLPGATTGVAHAIAERVRARFAADNQFLDGRRLNATVSAGVAAVSYETDDHFEVAVAAADRALYTAKHNGRNRVERDEGEVPDTEAKIVRIA